MSSISQSVADPNVTAERKTQDGGIPEKDQPKTEVEEILHELNNLRGEVDYRDAIITIFRPILAGLKNLDERLEVDYHVVFFNKNIKQRFTIVESDSLGDSDQGTEEYEDYKELSMGVVGILNSKMKNSNFLMIHFSRNSDTTPIVFYDNPSDAYVALQMDERRAKVILQKEKNWIPGVVYSVDNSRKFAIASIKISDTKKQMIGAITIDFTVDDYPYFAFRKEDISLIYNSLNTMKNMIEFMLWNAALCKPLSEAYSIVSRKTKTRRKQNKDK